MLELDRLFTRNIRSLYELSIARSSPKSVSNPKLCDDNQRLITFIYNLPIFYVNPLFYRSAFYFKSFYEENIRLYINYYAAALHCPGSGKRGIILASPVNNSAGDTYAIVIGISKYKDVTPLKFADRDARVFAEYLISRNGASLDSNKVKLFVNENATLNNIGNALSDIMIGKLKKGDRIVFFFAGHGDYDANILKDQALLLLFAAPKQNYFQNIFSGDFISTADLNSRFVEPLVANGCEVVLIVDACHATGLNKNLSGGAEGGKVTSMALQNMTSPVKLYSCQANEYSMESEQWGGGRGLFSYVLMEALYGMADADNNKIVSLRELQRYVEDNVSSMASPNKQNPIIKIENATQPISKVNAGFLASYRSEKNKELTFIAKVDTKGSIDGLNEMDSIQKQLYKQCDSLTEKMELDAAYNIFLSFAKKDSSSDASLYLRRNLSAALQQKTAVILNPMLEDVSKFRSGIKDLERAQKDLEKAAALLGEHNFLYKNLQARILFLKALLISRQKDNTRKKEAINYLHQSVALEPNAPYTYYFLGTLFNLSGSTYRYDSAGVFHNLDSAKFYLNKYIDLIPKSSYGFNALGALNDRLGDQQQAIKNFNRSIELQPDNALFYKNRAVCFSNLKNYEEAIKNYRKAIDLDTTAAKHYIFESYNNLGVVYERMNDHGEALKAYKKALEYRPNHIFANQNLGELFYKIKIYDSSLLYFSRIIKLQPAFSYAYVLVGKANAALNNYAQALKNYRKCLEFKEVDEEAYYHISSLYAQQKIIDSSLQYFELCLKNLNSNSDVNLSVIANDLNLDNIRAIPEFKTMLTKYFKEEELHKFPDMYKKHS